MQEIEILEPEKTEGPDLLPNNVIFYLSVKLIKLQAET